MVRKKDTKKRGDDAFQKIKYHYNTSKNELQEYFQEKNISKQFNKLLNMIVI